MEQNRKILIIDKSPERKKRIRALKDRGFAVYPALKITEARLRCKPGSYDLIIVNSGDEREAALELCSEIQQRAPKQLLLLIADRDNQVSGPDYAVSPEEDELVNRVDGMLKPRSRAAEVPLAA